MCVGLEARKAGAGHGLSVHRFCVQGPSLLFCLHICQWLFDVCVCPCIVRVSSQGHPSHSSHPLAAPHGHMQQVYAWGWHTVMLGAALTQPGGWPEKERGFACSSTTVNAPAAPVCALFFAFGCKPLSGRVYQQQLQQVLALLIGGEATWRLYAQRRVPACNVRIPQCQVPSRRLGWACGSAGGGSGRSGATAIFPCGQNPALCVVSSTGPAQPLIVPHGKFPWAHAASLQLGMAHGDAEQDD